MASKPCTIVPECTEKSRTSAKTYNSCTPKTLLYGSSKKSLSAKSGCSRDWERVENVDADSFS